MLRNQVLRHSRLWIALAVCLAAALPIGTALAAKQRNTTAAEINTQLGEGYLAKGELKRALDKLNKAVLADAKYSPAHSLLAMLYEQIDQPENAEKSYRKVLSLEPKSGSANNNYGAFLCRHNRGKEGLGFFDRAMKDPFYETPVRALVNKGVCAAGLGENKLADASLREALNRDPDNTEALISMAQLQYDQKNYMKARAFLERFQGVAAMTPDILALGIMVEKELGDAKRANDYKARLVQNFPDSDQARAIAETQSP